MNAFDCADQKKSAFYFCKSNMAFGAPSGIHHWFQDVDAYLSGDGWCYEHQETCCCTKPPGGIFDFRIIGASCKPFSRTRNKRSVEGDVLSHRDTSNSIDKLADLLSLSTCAGRVDIVEQVPGFLQRLSPKDSRRPYDLLAAALAERNFTVSPKCF